MVPTDPFASSVNTVQKGLMRDREEDEFVRNYILDRCETYTLNPVERAICRTWVREEVASVLFPLVGGLIIGLPLRPLSPRFSKVFVLSGIMFSSFTLAQGGTSRPAIEFPHSNPLFEECIAACQKKFPQGQVVHRTKWIHDARFKTNSLVEYPLSQSTTSDLPNTQLVVKTPMQPDVFAPLRFWVKLRTSRMAQQLMSSNSTTDKVLLLKALEKVQMDKLISEAPHSSTRSISVIQRSDALNSASRATSSASALLTAIPDDAPSSSAAAKPDDVDEIEEQHIPVSQWPDLHPDVNIDALERLAESRRQAQREKRALKKAQNLLPDGVHRRSELAQ